MKITVSQYARSLFESLAARPEGDVKDVLKNFFTLLVRDRQENKLPEILEEFSRIWDKAQGEVPAELISARELTPEAKKVISGYLQAKTGAKKINLTERIDGKILGGFILRYANKIVDGSLRRNLSDLKNKISN